MPDGQEPLNLPALRAGAPGEKKRAKDGTRRGRRPGSRNKSTLLKANINDHLRQTAGMTAGQQMADLWMVTKKEIAQAKRWAKLGGLADYFGEGMPSPDSKLFTALELGFMFKVFKVRTLYQLTSKDALAFLSKMQSELASYTNNRQGSIEAPKDEEGDYATIDAVPVDASFLENIPQNQEVDVDVDDLLTGEGSPD